jgi:hypothetical protein
MTQPPTPEQSATEIHAGADEFVNTVLTDAVSRLDAGTDLLNVTGHIGVGLVEMDASRKELTVIAARALARLAGLHHAVEQLADTWTQLADRLPTEQVPGVPVGADERQAMAEATQACAEGLRELVDDHG